MPLKPSDFVAFPEASVLQSCEAEVVAKNVMIVQRDLGDEWREVTEQEYLDGCKRYGFSGAADLSLFRKVQKYTTSPTAAAGFSEVWWKIATAEERSKC